MNDNYLWDRTGEPDAEVQQLEELLRPLRYQPRPLEIPATVNTRRRRKFIPLAIAAAIALLMVGAGLWMRFANSKPRQMVQAKSGPQPSAPSQNQPAARESVVISSAPQIRYPDCYGIDMSKLGHFIAFHAAIELLKERSKQCVITDVHERIKEMERCNKLHTENAVRLIYKPFTTLEISDKIAQLITPKNLDIPVQVIYQTIEDLHECCPTNTGDWYFTGNYPTPGGNKVVNKAFLNYMEGKDVRGY